MRHFASIHGPPFCFLPSPKALIPRWLNLTVGKDRSHARFLEEEPVEVEGPQGSWEGSNLWSFPPIFPPCSNSRGTFEPVEFRVWLRLVDNFQWTTPRRHHVADSPGVTRSGDAIISLLFTTARYVDVPMEKPRGLAKGRSHTNLFPLLEEDYSLCTTSSSCSFLLGSWKEEADSWGGWYHGAARGNSGTSSVRKRLRREIVPSQGY